MAHDLELTLMLADYHRTRPLLNGEVTAQGIKLQPRRAETGEACMRPVYEEFDIAEMSLSWYMMARCRNEPVIDRHGRVPPHGGTMGARNFTGIPWRATGGMRVVHLDA